MGSCCPKCGKILVNLLSDGQNFLKFADLMASRSELRGVLKQNQRNSKTADERFLSRSSSKHQGKVKEGKRRDADSDEPARSNASGHSRTDDELIKYMSKLPGYLQREEREGKVLSIGVLDWGSLEKWKHSKKGGIVATERNDASSSGPNSLGRAERKVSTRPSGIVVPKDSRRCKIDEHSASCSNLRMDYACRDLLLHSVPRDRCALDSEPVSRDSLNKQQKPGFGYKSSVRDREEADPGTCRKTQLTKDSGSGLFSDMGNSGVSLGVRDRNVVRDAEAKQKALNLALDAVTGDKSIRSSKFSTMVDSVAKQSFKNDGTRKIPEEFQDSEAGFAPRKQENQFGEIFLLRPRIHTRSALPGEFLMPQDDNLKPDEFSTYSGELRSLIPRSYPLSLDFERDSESVVAPLRVDLSSNASTEELFGRKHSKKASRILDQEKTEEESRRSRHPSPGKRFSFSFSRLSRSFSFKEDSATQPMSSDDSSSVESSHVRFDGSACPPVPVKPEKKKTHLGARASPLRRLLDPLLKSKGTEIALPSKARSSSSNLNSTKNSVLLEDEKKPETSTTTARALVQLTIRNGFPLFQFVVDDSSSSILGATMNSSPSSMKDDSVRYVTFYSVNEMKKKSGRWLIHGSKEKQRFAYNMVGQMRLSNSLSSDLTEQKSRNHCAVRESVLFDFKLKQSDEATEKAKASRELAAVVIKRPGESTCPGNADKLGTASVILPGGVHGFPNKGAPSPLIDRWRSGGLCDCGGWDVGCKLRVLSNQRCFHEFPESFQLLREEGGPEQDLRAFRMTPLKPGMYKVEFSSWMLPLQAFFVSVTVILCDCEGGYEETEISSSTWSGQRGAWDDDDDDDGGGDDDDDERKKREMPLRCSSFNPPLSPVGRV